ncbi:hypothetical protein [Deinococcus phoenicis]|uniref:hypothetical protein n=1 Tax=Deinococcus phoenicis TaxID=1476583 RepID=UPI000553833D|nr:hypothetical protein [Deinococcus phoenicis]
MSLQKVACQLQHEEGCLISDLLLRLVDVAVRLHTLSVQAEHVSEGVIQADAQLERLSAEFDQAHARAVDLGIPLDTQFQLDLSGNRYTVSLTEDGLEYRLLS